MADPSTHALTAAGVHFCLSLAVVDPTYETCEKAIFQNVGSFMGGPIEVGANLSDTPEWPAFLAKQDGCVLWASFVRFDGTTGYEHFCWRRAEWVWIPEAGRYRWVFPDREK